MAAVCTIVTDRLTCRALIMQKQERLLTLADHKRIANLQLVLV